MKSAPVVPQKRPYREALEASFQQNGFTSPEWIKQIRASGYQRFQEMEFPTKKVEAWKYTSLNSILNTPYLISKSGATQEVDEKSLETFFLPEADRLVFLNGIHSPQFSSLHSLPSGTILQNLATTLKENPDQVRPYFTQQFEEDSNPFSVINTFSFQDGVYFSVPDETVIDLPIQLLFASVGTKEPTAAYPKLIFVIGNGSKVNLLLDQVGLSKATQFNDTVLELRLGKNARLNTILLQREEEQTNQFLNMRCQLDEGSHLDWMTFTRGGALTRNEFLIDFVGENASVDLRSLSVLSKSSKLYHNARVNHKVPHCTSRQHTKNILADMTQAEFTSLVHVLRDAQKSDSDQLNRNLLLSDLARAFSRPQLKIDNDDVKCSHGASTGQMVGDELFYLRSRGIDKKLASFILTYSFADEILSTLPVDSIRATLEGEVHKELDKILENVEPEKMGVV